MALPFSKDELAAYAAVIGGAVFGAYKLYLRVRKDHREDSSEARQHQGFVDLVERLGSDVKSARELNAAITRALDDEITKRRKVEEENDRLRRTNADQAHTIEQLQDQLANRD